MRAERLGQAGERRRLGGEEAAEVVVARLGGDLELPLERGEPRLHQVDVLQEGPAALARVARPLFELKLFLLAGGFLLRNMGSIEKSIRCSSQS